MQLDLKVVRYFVLLENQANFHLFLVLKGKPISLFMIHFGVMVWMF